MTENNAPQFEVNDVTERDPFSESPAPSTGKAGGKHLLKFLIAFIAILVIVGGGYFAWNNYLSPSARSARQMQANYQKYLDWQNKYEAAMTADTYGGKTPEETLAMFVDALKKGDTELASKYFLISDKTPQSVWKAGLDKQKSTNKIIEVINIINSVTFDKNSSDSSTAWFISKNKDGMVEYSVILKLNTYSNVWKIENM